jgi:hypothetical protein
MKASYLSQWEIHQMAEAALTVFHTTLARLLEVEILTGGLIISAWTT